MSHFSLRRVVSVLACLLAAPMAMPGQSTGNIPDLGWNPLTAPRMSATQRRDEAFLHDCRVAHMAHDYRAEVEICNRAIPLLPDDPVRYNVRAAALVHLGQYDQAATDLARASELAARTGLSQVSARTLLIRAWLHEGKREYAAAIQDLRAALQLNAKSTEILNALAWFRATVPVEALRNGRESVQFAQQAVALSTRNEHSTLDTLAAAHAEAGDYPQAVDFEKRAMAAAGGEISDPAGARKWLEQAACRLQLYEQNQPYHADLSMD